MTAVPPTDPMDTARALLAAVDRLLAEAGRDQATAVARITTAARLLRETADALDGGAPAVLYQWPGPSRPAHERNEP